MPRRGAFRPKYQPEVPKKEVFCEGCGKPYLTQECENCKQKSPR